MDLPLRYAAAGSNASHCCANKENEDPAKIRHEKSGPSSQQPQPTLPLLSGEFQRRVRTPLSPVSYFTGPTLAMGILRTEYALNSHKKTVSVALNVATRCPMVILSCSLKHIELDSNDFKCLLNHQDQFRNVIDAHLQNKYSDFFKSDLTLSNFVTIRFSTLRKRPKIELVCTRYGSLSVTFGHSVWSALKELEPCVLAHLSHLLQMSHLMPTYLELFLSDMVALTPRDMVQEDSLRTFFHQKHKSALFKMYLECFDPHRLILMTELCTFHLQYLCDLYVQLLMFSHEVK